MRTGRDRNVTQDKLGRYTPFRHDDLGVVPQRIFGHLKALQIFRVSNEVFLRRFVHELDRLGAPCRNTDRKRSRGFVVGDAKIFLFPSSEGSLSAP